MLRFLLVVVLLLAASIARADLPSPRLDRIMPLGGAAGSSVEVEINANDCEEPKLIFDHAGITAEPIEKKERWFKVTIKADVPEGTYDCRVSGKYGVSSPRLFAVAHGLADVAEVEPNNTPDKAQAVTGINIAIAGISDNNEQDVFRFTAAKGQRLSLDCLATRLDSPLDAAMHVTTAAGAIVGSSGDYFGRDPFIDFVAPEAGEYLLTVHDLSYRGGLPYRLVISDRPHVENVFPRVIQAEQTAEVTILGRNFADGASASAWTLLDKPLQERKVSVAGPADVLRLGAFRFLEHPTQHTVLPTAATCTLSGWQFRPDCGGGKLALNATTMMISDSPVTLEAEPNEAAAPQKIALPAIVSGRFNQPRDADWFEFTPVEGGNYTFDVYCERIAGQGDPYIVVVDSKGNRVKEIDDYGHRINAFDGHLRDPSDSVSLNGKEMYRVLVQDRYQRGGARYQYVLSIEKATPDFFIATIHSANPGPGGTTIWRGGAAYYDVIAHQRGGYNEPITLTAENLPPGVHATATTIGVGNSGTFVVWADENADISTSAFRLIASGKRGEETFTREVRPYARVWGQGDGSSRPMREHVVAVREKAPFSLKFVPERLTVAAGQKAEVKLQLARLSPDCKEQLNILPLAWPGNFKTANGQFSGAATEIALTIDVQAGTRAGEHTLAVLGQGQVAFGKAADGKDKKNTLVSLPSQPLTITVVAPAK